MQNNLFSRKNLEDTLKNYQIPEIENKIEVLQKWVREIKNGGIYGKTESECEQAFNQDIFQNVLDYTKYPELQYTIEPKGSTVMTAQKADAILGYFSAKQQMDNANHVQAVVEIKDANTSLDAPQKREGHLSPVQQGFKYKPQYEKCVWIIVTNFKEIRLYKDNQITGQSRNLVDLVNPEKDYLNLKFFYYILNAKNFLAIPGEKESKTLKALSEVKIYQKEISNKFYKEYKKLRLGLISDLHKRNPDKEIDFVIQKAQKIIDRIIFIHFCEDLGLLPEGGLENQLKAVGTIAGLNKWKALCLFFEAVDKGDEGLHIPEGYNGGLFKSDFELNSLVVGDQICQDLVSLGDYDYGEDLTVNILGHIFEQSISDLEKIKLDLLGTKLETEDYGEAEGVSKRKKDGIFYTPEYIVDYIVRNSLGKYLEEKYHKIEKEALKGLKKDAGEKTIQQRDNKIYTEYKKVLGNIKVCDPACGSGAFLVKVFDYLLSEHQRVANLLQQDSLFDQNEIYKDILQKNIYGVDLNPESVEITKLSLWLKTANKGKKLTNLDANIKCGNSLIDDPEVAGEKAFNWQEQFPEVFENGGFDVVVGNPPYVVVKKETIGYEDYKYNSDLYLMFFEKSLNGLVNKQRFAFGFISPRFFLVNKNCTEFRKYILSNVNLVKLVETSPFSDADTECIISIIDSNKQDNIDLFRDKNGEIEKFGSIEKQFCLNSPDFIINTQTSLKDINLLIKMEKNIVSLGKISKSKRGVEIGKADLRKNLSGEKCLIGQDINKYCLLFEKTYINVNHKEFIRLKDFFIGNCIYLRRVAKELIAFYGNDFAYNKNIYGIKITNADFSEKYILCLLNSLLLTYYYKVKFSTKKGDLFPEIQTYLYEKLPIKVLSLREQKPFIEKADLMLNLNKEFHDELSQTFIFLSQKFGLQKITTKLEKFWELDFSVFKKELKIGKITMMEEEDLMKRFENKKKYFESKLAEIESVDNSIDEMVFDLYGLTKEEREIVRGK